MSGLNVERMRRHVNRTSPDTFVVHSLDEDYWERINEWQARMVAKRGEGGTAHLSLDPETGVVTAKVIAYPERRANRGAK